MTGLGMPVFTESQERERDAEDVDRLRARGWIIRSPEHANTAVTVTTKGAFDKPPYAIDALFVVKVGGQFFEALVHFERRNIVSLPAEAFVGPIVAKILHAIGDPLRVQIGREIEKIIETGRGMV